MAPSSGHLLVPKLWKVARLALRKTQDLVRNRLEEAARRVNPQLEPIPIRNAPRQPINKIAALRQSKRYFSSFARRVVQDGPSTQRGFGTLTSGRGNVARRSELPSSNVGAAVGRLTARAPFATTLRPNLTGGALGRTAGGYANGAGRVGGARYFSHSPASPAEVINNVSAAVRAFWISGSKAQFDGVSPVTGGKRFKTVSKLQDESGRKMRSVPRATPGSHIDFQVSPTITALTPLGNVVRSANEEKSADFEKPSLNAEGLLDVLSVDFARTLKDLAAIMNDLKRLSTLGDLPLSAPTASSIRVSFPGCDAATVEGLCIELGIQRGVVRQDPGFDKYAGSDMALMFPFAPSSPASEGCMDEDPVENYFMAMNSPGPAKRDPRQLTREEISWREMMDSGSERSYSLKSDSGFDSPPSRNQLSDYDDTDHPLRRRPRGEFLSPSVLSDLDAGNPALGSEYESLQPPSDEDYEGLEGIHRFLEQCEEVRGLSARW